MSLVFLKIGFLLHQKLYGVWFPVPLKWDINNECFTAENTPSRLWRWKLVVYIGAGLLANVGGSLLLIRNFYTEEDQLKPTEIMLCICIGLGVFPSVVLNHLCMRARYELAEGMNSLLTIGTDIQSTNTERDVLLLGKLLAFAYKNEIYQ